MLPASNIVHFLARKGYAYFDTKNILTLFMLNPFAPMMRLNSVVAVLIISFISTTLVRFYTV